MSQGLQLLSSSSGTELDSEENDQHCQRTEAMLLQCFRLIEREMGPTAFCGQYLSRSSMQMKEGQTHSPPFPMGSSVFKALEIEMTIKKKAFFLHLQ